MNKTQLRAKLTVAVNSARNLKTTGLALKYYWHETHMRGVVKDLRAAADAIEEYLGSPR